MSHVLSTERLVLRPVARQYPVGRAAAGRLGMTPLEVLPGPLGR